MILSELSVAFPYSKWIRFVFSLKLRILWILNHKKSYFVGKARQPWFFLTSWDIGHIFFIMNDHLSLIVLICTFIHNKLIYSQSKTKIKKFWQSWWHAQKGILRLGRKQRLLKRLIFVRESEILIFDFKSIKLLLFKMLNFYYCHLIVLTEK